MDFTAVIIVLVTYFIRPQDWMPGMSGMNIVKPLMALAILAMLTRQRGFSLGALFRSPLDWVMLAYGGYIVVTAPDTTETFKGIFVLLAFYYVTSQALHTRRQLAIYLNWWFASIMIIAAMAVLSEYGIDLTHAHDLTHSVPSIPRLVLNTYLFNNPNSLGHTVVLAIPMAYFIMIWKRGLGRRIIGLGCILLAGYCVYLTQSKGAYLAGLAVFAASQIVGRRPIVQVIVLALGVTFGWALVSQLPRMEQLTNARQDEAILGRLLAWEEARAISRQLPNGEGWKQFQAVIEFDGEEVVKATHSAYILIGAELGRYGMFLFLAVLYCGLRIIVRERPPSVTDDRSRRILFVLLAGYIISGWMIDRSYHLEYFLMSGAIASFHRRLGVRLGAVEPDSDQDEEEEEEKDEEDGEGDDDTTDETPESREPHEKTPEVPEREPAMVAGSENPDEVRRKHRIDADAIHDLGDVEMSGLVSEIVEEELEQVRYWRRFGVLDLIFCIGLTKFAFEMWDYILANF